MQHAMAIGTDTSQLEHWH